MVCSLHTSVCPSVIQIRLNDVSYFTHYSMTLALTYLTYTDLFLQHKLLRRLAKDCVTETILSVIGVSTENVSIKMEQSQHAPENMSINM